MNTLCHLALRGHPTDVFKCLKCLPTKGRITFILLVPESGPFHIPVHMVLKSDVCILMCKNTKRNCIYLKIEVLFVIHTILLNKKDAQKRLN